MSNIILPFRYAAKLRTSTGMQNDKKNGKSIMTSHKISDRDNGAKHIFVLVFKYCILLILRYTFSKNVDG